MKKTVLQRCTFINRCKSKEKWGRECAIQIIELICSLAGKTLRSPTMVHQIVVFTTFSTEDAYVTWFEHSIYTPLAAHMRQWSWQNIAPCHMNASWACNVAQECQRIFVLSSKKSWLLIRVFNLFVMFG